MRLLPPDFSGTTGGRNKSSPVNPASSASLADKNATLVSSSLKSPLSLDNVQASHTKALSPQGGEALRNLLQNLNLPRDALSEVIISAARQFSLPLEPGLLRSIRREALSLPEKRREAGALGAAAAASKGLRLSREALNEYAAAIDPTGRDGDGEHPDSGGYGGGAGGDEGRNSGGSGEGGQSRQDRKEDTPETEDMDGEDLAARLREISEKEHTPVLLNKIPGKAGKRWIVLPFDFSSGGIEFRVSVRILYNERLECGHGIEHLALDILSPERHWRFSLYNPETADRRGSVQIEPFPAAGERKQLQKELAGLFTGLTGDIRLEKGGNMRLFAEDTTFSLPQVNEEV